MEWHEELHQKLDQILRRIDGIMATMQPEADGAAVELGRALVQHADAGD